MLITVLLELLEALIDLAVRHIVVIVADLPRTDRKHLSQLRRRKRRLPTKEFERSDLSVPVLVQCVEAGHSTVTVTVSGIQWVQNENTMGTQRKQNRSTVGK